MINQLEYCNMRYGIEGVVLREYQEYAAKEIINLYKNGHKSILYVLPTGGGKTAVFCDVLNTAIARNKKAAVFTHRKHLVDQAQRSLAQFGLYKKVPVYTVQTQGLDKLDLDFIVFDEAHHAPAESWDTLLKANPNAKLLGVTATPWRMDGKPLGNVFDSAVEGPSIQHLIHQGFLVMPKVWTPPDDEAADDPIRLYKTKAKGKRTIIFTNTIKSAKKMAEDFVREGIKATTISASTPTKKRVEIFKDFEAGKLKVLTSCDVISEGLDIPSIECVMLLRATDSSALYLQQVGRVMRPYKNKKEGLILDCVNNVTKHGDPLETRHWSLKRGPNKLPSDDEKIIPVDRYSIGRKEMKLNPKKRLIKMKHSKAIRDALKVAADQWELGYQWAKMLDVAILRKKFLDEKEVKTEHEEKNLRGLNETPVLSDIHLENENV